MKKLCKGILIAVCVLVGVYLLCIMMLIIGGLGMDVWHEKNHMDDYGVFAIDPRNTYQKQFIKSFFPAELRPEFEDVQYKLRERDLCRTTFEITLEFTIEDHQFFESYVKEVTEGINCSTFAYDPRFDDYVIRNLMNQCPNIDDHDDTYYIEDVEMGRILVCEEEQRIIYIALMVSGCCGDDADKFDFFNRFDIDPLEYYNSHCVKE